VITVVAAVIEHDDRLLVTRRLQGVHLEGLWEFPGGKIDPGESHRDALLRELLEELGVQAEIGELILSTTHAYQDVEVTLHFYSCTLKGVPIPQLGQEMRWVTREELSQLGFPEADTELIKRLTTSAAR
jgi:mutator protein MutT